MPDKLYINSYRSYPKIRELVSREFALFILRDNDKENIYHILKTTVTVSEFRVQIAGIDKKDIEETHKTLENSLDIKLQDWITFSQTQ